jgi:hypothetical protein
MEGAEARLKLGLALPIVDAPDNHPVCLLCMLYCCSCTTNGSILSSLQHTSSDRDVHLPRESNMGAVPVVSRIR